MGKRLWALIRKEFIQIGRDRRTLAMMIFVPVIWLAAFGYAATFDVKHIPLAVVNQGDSELAKKLVDALKEDEALQVSMAASREAIEADMESGKIKLGLVIPADFGKAPAEGQPAPQVEILVDGSDFFSAQAGIRSLYPPLQQVAAQLAAEQAKLAGQQVQALLTTQAQAIKNLSEQITLQARTIAELQSKLGAPRPGATPPSTAVPPSTPPGQAPASAPVTPPSGQAVSLAKTTIKYNPELRSANVMIPGLTGMVILFITTLMTALGIVREKEQGTLEQIVVSPITSFELILGKLIPYTLIGILDFALVVTAGIYMFNVPFAGNLAAFVALAVLFLMSTLGLGLLVSTLAQNQQQAIQMAMFMVFPQFLLSGFVFPLDAMPVVIRYASYLFPLTYFMPIARGMFLKGIGLDLLWQPTLLLGIYGVAMITFASARFRRRLG